MPRRRAKPPAGADAAQESQRLTRDFRRSKDARSTSFEWLNGLTEATAYDLFKELRFAENGGAPFCPECGSTKYYDIEKRPKYWACANNRCRKQFSVTSGTIFHSRKLSFLKLVKMTFEFAGCAKGEPALRQTQKLQTEVKGVWVNFMKMREAMSARRNEVVLSGMVEMDAVWIGGKARRYNRVKKQKEREEREKTGAGYHAYMRGKRAVMVVRERGGDSVMFAADAETPEVAMSAVERLTLPGTIIVTDQSPAYASVGDIRLHNTVNHSVAFSEDGISSNWAEGELARIRRAHYGTHHYFSTKYLDFYAGEMCWREDRRFTGNLEQATEILTRCLRHPQSRHFKGYWQNYLLPGDEPNLTEVRWARVPGAAAVGLSAPEGVEVAKPRKGKSATAAPALASEAMLALPPPEARDDAPLLVEVEQPFQVAKIRHRRSEPDD